MLPDQLPLFTESAPDTPTHNDAVSLLALASIQGIGFGTAKIFADALKSRLERVWSLSPQKLQTYLKLARTPHPEPIIQAITTRSQSILDLATERYNFLQHRRGVSVILRGSPLYPQQLHDLDNPPSWIITEGDANLLSAPAIVAVVGTREPTNEGLFAARRLSTLLVISKSIVLSGLAEGIDAVGHQTAVDYGSPTIAVLGHGIDVLYPASTAGLRRQIIERGGLVVSEYLPNDTYNRDRFIQRNRIQAALSRAVAVIEGRSKSGTAHTVRFAENMKRAIFGVCIGELRSIPQHELLYDLRRGGKPVFDLTQLRNGQLREYLHAIFPPESRHHRTETPRLFLGLLNEFKHLADQYSAKPEEINWLIDQLKQFRSHVSEGEQNASQGDSS